MINFFRSDDTMLIFSKKMLRNQGCVVFLCFALLFINGWICFHNLNMVNGIAFGAFICNTVWTLLFYLDLYSDYQLEKHRYKLIKELEDQHELEKNIEFLKEKQKQYDSMISTLQARHEYPTSVL